MQRYADSVPIYAIQGLQRNVKQKGTTGTWYHEYWLITNSLLTGEAPKKFKSWMKWDNGTKEIVDGEIHFCYTQLGALKNEISLKKI